jgi:hypothetical protein
VVVVPLTVEVVVVTLTEPGELPVVALLPEGPLEEEVSAPGGVRLTVSPTMLRSFGSIEACGLSRVTVTFPGLLWEEGACVVLEELL